MLWSDRIVSKYNKNEGKSKKSDEKQMPKDFAIVNLQILSLEDAENWMLMKAMDCASIKSFLKLNHQNAIAIL